MEERIYTVYMHTCNANGKRYIGITMQKVNRRWGIGGNGYKNSSYFHSAIKKYGWDNFKHEIILLNLTKAEAEMFEIGMIKYYKSSDRSFGYNIDLGGNSTGKISDETKRKLRLSNLGKIVPKKTRIKISNSLKGKYIGKNSSNYGKELSKERKEKISNANSGEKHHFYGKHHSLDARNKISKAHKGKKLPEEHRKNIIKSLTGRKHSESTKNKISKSNKGKAHGEMSAKTRLKISAKLKGVSRDCSYLRTPIINITTGDIFISIKDAANEYGVSASRISEACNGKAYQAYGFEWAFITNDLEIKYPVKLVKKYKRRVINITTGQIFESIKEANDFYQKERSGIDQVCRGKMRYCFGCEWEYIDN